MVLIKFNAENEEKKNFSNAAQNWEKDSDNAD